MSFTDLADERLLRSAKLQLGELQWDVEVDGNLRIPVPPNLEGILRLMARRGLQPLLSREVRYVSHDPEVWRALAIFTGNGDAIEAELQQRLTSVS